MLCKRPRSSPPIWLSLMSSDQGHVPVFRIRHTFVNRFPGTISVPSGMVTSSTNATSISQAPRSSVGLAVAVDVAEGDGIAVGVSARVGIGASVVCTTSTSTVWTTRTTCGFTHAAIKTAAMPAAAMRVAVRDRCCILLLLVPLPPSVPTATSLSHAPRHRNGFCAFSCSFRSQ